MGTSFRNPLNMYVDMNVHDTEEKIAEKLAKSLAPALAKMAINLKGRSGLIEMRFCVFKDMWDNYGDYFRCMVSRAL